MNAVVALMVDPSTTLAKACEVEHTDQDKVENHEGAWSSLDAVQKQLVKLLADDATAKPFSKSVLTKSPRGNYVFESDAFERWVKTLG